MFSKPSLVRCAYPTLKKHKNAPRLEDHKQVGGCSGAEIVGQRTGEEKQTTTEFALA
jgi:hypothetical protein